MQIAQGGGQGWRAEFGPVLYRQCFGSRGPVPCQRSVDTGAPPYFGPQEHSRAVAPMAAHPPSTTSSALRRYHPFRVTPTASASLAWPPDCCHLALGRYRPVDNSGNCYVLLGAGFRL